MNFITRLNTKTLYINSTRIIPPKNIRKIISLASETGGLITNQEYIIPTTAAHGSQDPNTIYHYDLGLLCNNE